MRPPKVKFSPRLAKIAFTTFQRIGYKFVDLSAESSSLNSRVVEYSFVMSKLVKRQRGKVLDIGCTDSDNIVPLMLASLGWEVYGIDNRGFKFEHPNFRFVLRDIRNTSFPDNFFDYAYAVSTLEHIGLKGRYGVTEEDSEGDIKAAREIARIVRSDGIFLVTIPYGKRKIVRPLHRVYDASRLQKLLSEWKIAEATYCVLKEGYWITVPEEVAAQKDHLGGERALALLELITLK